MDSRQSNSASDRGGFLWRRKHRLCAIEVQLFDQHVEIGLSSVEGGSYCQIVLDRDEAQELGALLVGPRR